MSDAILNKIRALQRQGLIHQAIHSCEQACRINPERMEYLALSALLAAQNQEFERAQTHLTLLQQSESEYPFDADMLTDIAGTHIVLGESAHALHRLTQALQIQPEHILATIRQGMVYLQTGQPALAIANFTEGLIRLPESEQGSIYINLARCYLNLGNALQALDYVEQARQLGASNREQWLFVAVDSYLALNRWPEAEQIIQQAIQNGIPKYRCLLLQSLLSAAQGQHDSAELALRQTLQDEPENIEVITLLVELVLVRGHVGEALHFLKQATQLAPENIGFWVQLAQLDLHYAEGQIACSAVETALKLSAAKIGLERAQAFVALAQLKAHENLLPEAEHSYRLALQQQPDSVAAKMGLGHLLLQWGRVTEATSLFESVAQLNPLTAWNALISTRQFPGDPTVLSLIEQMAYLPSLEGPVRSGLLFDLAATYDHHKEYAKALLFVTEANQATRQFLSYSAETHRDYCRRLQQNFSKAFFESRFDYGHPSELPVFVCGMPRSGTTLVEQLLGGHPEIFVAGEIGLLSKLIQKLKAWEQHLGSDLNYPECVWDLTQTQAYEYANQILDELHSYHQHARYIVDKLPHNFENIGLLRLLFPNAPIIHVLRDARDVAVSNYFTHYQAKFGGMGFAYDLADIGKHLVDYQQLMQHWHKVLAKPILTVGYEELVENPETVARTMLAYLELPWTPKVLAHENLTRAVKTASVWQVRQPIYQTSKAKWRHYAEFLEPLEQALAEKPTVPEPIESQIIPAGYFLKGMHYLQSFNNQAAESVFRRILAQYPKHAAACHMLGVSLLQQKNYQDAIPYLEESIKRHPGHAEWHHNLKIACKGINPPDHLDLECV